MGAPKKLKVVTTSIIYKRYREIPFQKVALGYLLHFVQNGSSKNILKNVIVAQQYKKSEKYTARRPFGSTENT